MNSAILWEQKHLQFQLSSVVSFFTGHKPDSNCLRGEVADTDKPLFISNPHTRHLIQAKMKRNARIQCISMGTCKRESWRHGKKEGGGGKHVILVFSSKVPLIFSQVNVLLLLHRALGSSGVLCLNHWFLANKFREKDLQSGELATAGEQVFFILNSPLEKQRGLVHKCLTSLVIQKDKW